DAAPGAARLGEREAQSEELQVNDRAWCPVLGAWCGAWCPVPRAPGSARGMRCGTRQVAPSTTRGMRCGTRHVAPSTARGMRCGTRHVAPGTARGTRHEAPGTG